jgi:ABC-2 type transport system permease protein
MLKFFQFEWRQTRRGFLIGSLVIILLQAMFAGMGHLYIGNPDIAELMKSMPQGLMEGFGIHLESLSTFEGWMASEPYTFYSLLLGFFAMNWAAGSVAKERDRKTAEFLFSLPRSRTHVFWSKWAANVSQIVLIGALAIAVVLALGSVTGAMVQAGAVADVLIAGLFVTLGLMGIGYAVSPWLESERVSLSIGLGIVLLMFLFNLLSSFDERLNWLAKLSLFHLFDAFAVSQGGGLAAGGISISLLLLVIGSAAGWLALLKRDL